MTKEMNNIPENLLPGLKNEPQKILIQLSTTATRSLTISLSNLDLQEIEKSTSSKTMYSYTFILEILKPIKVSTNFLFLLIY